jgi:hypothetical protein
MRLCTVLLSIAVAALAQEAPPAATAIPSGVPLRVALERRVAIQRVGQPIQARLAEPIYVFDREVLPAGSVVEGHISTIGGVPAGRRLKAILSGNLTPSRDVHAQFDALVLGDGSRLSLRTSPSRGTAHTARVAKPRKGPAVSNGSAPRGAKDRLHDAATRPFTTPGKLSRLKSAGLGMLPYHRQAWQAGTLFNGVLEEPLTGLAPIPVDVRNRSVAEPGTQEVTARLLAPISSATARRGAPVEAVVTRPLFSADGSLLIPEGTRLLGDIVEAKPARRLHRNGKVLFAFRQVNLPAGAVQSVQGYLEGVETDFDAHIAVDSEGAARASSLKSRFIFPAIAIAAAGLSFHQDFDAAGVPDQDIAGRAESGAVGLGLIGTVLAQTSRTVASSIAIAGAGFSVYSTFIARGEDVVLPANTPVKVSLKPRGGEPEGGQPGKRRTANRTSP